MENNNYVPYDPQQPAYAQPEQPAYAQPEQPAYAQPEQPAYAQPVQPAYEQPVYAQPAQPVYEQPVQPVYEQPVYAQPAQPAQPVYEQPVYAQPVQPTFTPNPILESLASSSLTMGILSLALGAIFGIIFGAIGKNKAAEYGRLAGEVTGKAKVGAILSKIGFILGLVSTIILAIYIFVAVVLGFAIAETNYHY